LTEKTITAYPKMKDFYMLQMKRKMTWRQMRRLSLQKSCFFGISWIIQLGLKLSWTWLWAIGKPRLLIRGTQSTRLLQSYPLLIKRMPSMEPMSLVWRTSMRSW
jgi:hypothetical protein